MDDASREWTLEGAMAILHHPSVDAKSWAEAVEWLLIYGSSEVRAMLRSSAAMATEQSFPDLKPEGYTEDGEAVYRVGDLARALDVGEDEAVRLLAEKEARHGGRPLFAADRSMKKQ
jgi:hypothetical protein